jgi:hypothetical protein
VKPLSGHPALALACSPRIARNAVRIALFVGTLLNLINQGPRVWSGEPVSWLHLALNYIVPFCVATYSAVKNERSRTR